MSTPFDPGPFLQLFKAYNTAIWPVQVIAYALAIMAMVLVVLPIRNSNRLVADILTLFWVWVAVVFQWVFLRPTGPTAAFVGALFFSQALLFVLAGRVNSQLTFKVAPDAFGWVGGAIMAYALVAYPIIGALVGHGYPFAPLVGVTPCPTTIFTFGLLLWTAPRVPKYLLIIPFVWGIFSLRFALFMGVTEDFAAPLVALVATGMILWRNGLALHRPHIGLGHT